MHVPVTLIDTFVSCEWVDSDKSRKAPILHCALHLSGLAGSVHGDRLLRPEVGSNSAGPAPQRRGCVASLSVRIRTGPPISMGPVAAGRSPGRDLQAADGRVSPRQVAGSRSGPAEATPH